MTVTEIYENEDGTELERQIVEIDQVSSFYNIIVKIN